jgi:NADH:ubiquinone oxidoreductase subunit 4 (subunit M)
MLFLSIFTTLVSAIAGLALTNIRDPFFIKVISTFFSGLALLLSCILFIRFDPDSFYFQFHTTYSIGSESLNMLYSFGIDNMSVLFFLLSSLLVFSCTLFI